MSAVTQFVSNLRTVFPTEPLPLRFFWSECKDTSHDIPKSLLESLRGRPWPQITIYDWNTLTAPPYIARKYLEPSTYRYYLPSLLTGVFEKIAFIEYAIEGILPDNRAHYPKGSWWFSFELSLSIEQRAAIQDFTKIIRLEYWDNIGSDMQQYISDAEEIWGNSKT